MKNITPNPYKPKGSTLPLRKVVADVGQADWDRLFLSLPARGLQDRVMGHLFKLFITAFDATDIPNHYEPDNAKRIEDLLRGCTFESVDRGGGEDLNGRGEEESDSIAATTTEAQPYQTTFDFLKEEEANPFS